MPLSLFSKGILNTGNLLSSKQVSPGDMWKLTPWGHSQQMRVRNKWLSFLCPLGNNSQLYSMWFHRGSPSGLGPSCPQQEPNHWHKLYSYISLLCLISPLLHLCFSWNKFPNILPVPKSSSQALLLGKFKLRQWNIIPISRKIIS